MQMPENVHFTSCKHKSHLLNFFLALSQRSAAYSFSCTQWPKVGSSQSETGITKLLFEGQVMVFPSTLGACSWLSCPASVALLMQANARCWGTLSVHVCLHVKACTTTASPKGCSSASSCAHTKLHVSFCQQTCKMPLLCISDWNPAAKISDKACGILWGLAHFCMYVRANQDILQSCYRSLPVHPHLIRALDETTYIPNIFL